MAQLPQEEKAKIAEQVESFRQEKSKLDAEVAKWDDNGNDIIVLAKQMCMIMMEMTDFTRYIVNKNSANIYMLAFCVASVLPVLRNQLIE